MSCGYCHDGRCTMHAGGECQEAGDHAVTWFEGPMTHRVFPHHAGRVVDVMRARYAEKLLQQDVVVVRIEAPKLLRRQA